MPCDVFEPFYFDPSVPPPTNPSYVTPPANMPALTPFLLPRHCVKYLAAILRRKKSRFLCGFGCDGPKLTQVEVPFFISQLIYCHNINPEITLVLAMTRLFKPSLAIV